MFTLNFVLSLDVQEESARKPKGTYTVKKQVRFPYVPRIGEDVEFGDEKAPRETWQAYEVERVKLNTVDREFDITLQGFFYDPADIDDALDGLKVCGFEMVSFEDFEANDADDATDAGDGQ